MRKLLLSFIILGITSVLAIGATTAYFSDTEVSSANTFTAGTLDLTLDGGDSDIQKFNLNGMRPGNQPKGTYTLKNVGTVPGKLSLSTILVTDYENIWSEPEQSAGDSTNSIGELSHVVNLRIFLDLGGDGWISTGDPVVYNDKVVNLPPTLDLGKTLTANEEVKVVFLFDWWNTAMDNQAQNDSMVLDLAFTLQQ